MKTYDELAQENEALKAQILANAVGSARSGRKLIEEKNQLEEKILQYQPYDVIWL